jgi:hypothetical protein
VAGRQGAEDVIEKSSQMIRNTTVPMRRDYKISVWEASVSHEELKARIRNLAIDSSGDTKRKRLG